MASQAINAKSFCNYIVSLCTYKDGSTLTAANKTQLYDFLIEGVTPKIALNIGTAHKIINKLVKQIGSTEAITISNGSTQSILSYNTAKALVDKAFPSSKRSRFTTLNKIYNTNNVTSENIVTKKFTMVSSTSFLSRNLKGTLVGGGGGGSGAVAADGGKNAAYTLNSGSGAAGSTSQLTYNGITHQATGGSGGSSVSTGQVGGNPEVRKNGNNGSNGQSVSINIYVDRLKPITIKPGNGGGGGGGCGADYNSSGTFNGGNGSGTSGGGGHGSSNGYADDDDTFGGGGGGGGPTGTCGSNSFAGTSAHVGSRNSQPHATAGRGGLGGWTGNHGNNGEQPYTIGAGGKAGLAKYQTDVFAAGNGGNGGNSGGFILDTSCSMANVLLVY